MSLTIFISHPSHFLTDCQPHGDGLLAYAYLDRLARRGHRIHVAVPMMRLSGDVHPNIHLHPVHTFMRPSSDNPSPQHRVEYAFRVRALFERLRRATQFDVIHQLNPVVAGMSMFLASTGIPVVLGPVPPAWTSKPAGRLKQFALGRQFASAAAIVVPTQASLARLPDQGWIRDKVRQVNYGIDAQLFAPGSSEPIPAGPQTILFFANLMRRKGIFTLLTAFEQVASKLSDVRLTIAGGGPDQEEVQQAAARHTYTDRIDMLGAVNRADAPGVLRRAAVYCLPSYGEPFGMTALEAMACGKPVVATDAGGLGLLIPPDGGRKVAPGDAIGLAQALIEILASRELQASMGRVNRTVVEREYTWERVMSQWESVYEELVRDRIEVRTSAAPEVTQ